MKYIPFQLMFLSSISGELLHTAYIYIKLEIHSEIRTACGYFPLRLLLFQSQPKARKITFLKYCMIPRSYLI